MRVPFLLAALIGTAMAQEAPQPDPALQPQPSDPVEMPTPRAEPAQEPEPAPTVRAVIGATVIPGDGSDPVQDAVVLVQENRIIGFGARGEVMIPGDAEITDATGKFIMPGMVDAHVHFFQSGGIYTRPDVFDLRDIRPYEQENQAVRAALDANFQRYLAAGVTSVFDAGGPNWNFDVRAAARASRAPRVAVAGPLIATEPTPRQERMIVDGDQPIISAATPEEAANLARSLLPSSPDAMKIWGIGSDAAGTEKIRVMTKAVADVLEGTDIRIAVHATSLANAKAAVRGGADILVHSIDDQPVDDEFISLLKDKGVIYIPAIVVFEGYTDAMFGQPTLLAEERRLADPDVLASLYAMPAAMRRDNRIRTLQRIELAKTNAKAVHEGGARVAVGTDAGNVGTLHGGSIFRELLILEEAGIPRLDIISMATRNGSYVVSPDPKFGTIAEGMAADFLVMRQNPLEAIANVQSIETVWIRGRAIPRVALIPQTPEAIVQSQLDAYNRQDLEAFAGAFAKDIQIYYLPNTSNAEVSGKNELREVYGRLFSLADEEKIRCQVTNRVVEASFVIDQEICRGLNGRTIRAQATATYQIEDGKIRRIWFAR